MAMGSERSKSLHNFNLPCLKWGSQKFLKCVNVPSENHQSQPSSSLDPRSSRIKSKSLQPHINKIQPFPTKKLKVSILEDGGDEGGAVNERPWNLRTRRAACKAPQSTKPHEEKCNFFDVGIASSPVKEDKKKKKKKKKMKESERDEFKVPLSKEEVEHDFMALVGTKPPKRPKKRPRIVQRQLDTLFPGLWLTEVTAESYKVPDVPE